MFFLQFNDFSSLSSITCFKMTIIPSNSLILSNNLLFSSDFSFKLSEKLDLVVPTLENSLNFSFNSLNSLVLTPQNPIKSLEFLLEIR